MANFSSYIRDYWVEFFEELGFEYIMGSKSQIGQLIDKIEISPSQASMIRPIEKWAWLIKKNILIGCIPGKESFDDTQFCVIFKKSVSVFFGYSSERNDYEFFFKSLANPDKLPLCINLDYAKPIVEEWFKQ